MEIKRKTILGVGISLIDFQQTLDYCSEIIRNREKVYICLAPAHSIMDCYYDKRVKAIFNASNLTVADGMAVVWILKIKGFTAAERIYGPDLLLAMANLARKNNWKQFFYGSSLEILGDLENNLQEKFPDLKISGTYSPTFSEGELIETQPVIDMINSAAPDIIWVGLGSPKQDLWMAEHRHKFDAPIMIGVGAAFDFLSGHTAQAPNWIQRSGFEWLFRWMVEPRRLWKRYSKYPLFVLLVIWELIKG